MNLEMASIFSLGRGDSLQEVYLTQVFAFVLQNVPCYTINLLKNVFDFDVIKVHNVNTEVQTGTKRPDIEISCDSNAYGSMKFAIENKIAAPFTDDQITGYKEIYKRVFLVYKYLSDPAQGKSADKISSWYAICSKTKEFLKEHDASLSEVHKYLLDQFIKFLKENNMGIEKVESNIKEGLKSLKNFCDQIGESLETLKIEYNFTYKSSSNTALETTWHISTNTQSELYCCLKYYPFRLFTYYLPKGEVKIGKNIKEEFPDLGWVQNWRVVDKFQFDNFFTRSIEQQIDGIKGFIKKSIEALDSQ